MAPRLMIALSLVIAALLVLPATAATPKAGSWSGSTGQGKSISFKVTPGGGKVKNVKVGYRASCDNGAALTGRATLPGPFNVSDGRFSAKGGSTVVRGTFKSGTKASGTVRNRGSYFDPITFRSVPCDSGKVKWNAHK